MKALAWHGKGDIRCDTVPDPKIEHPRDAIIQMTACAICGSDLHLLDGVIPSMKSGDIVGHECMGVVVEIGSREQEAEEVGDRVVVPFTISCGECFFCKKRLLLRLRAVQPEREDGGSAVGALPGRPVRLLASIGRFPRRAGRVSAGAVCRCGADRGAGGADATSRCCSCRTSSRPATWALISARSKAARRSPCSAAGRWRSSPSAAPSCSAPSGSSRSIRYRSGCVWPRLRARSRSIS